MTKPIPSVTSSAPSGAASSRRRRVPRLLLFLLPGPILLWLLASSPMSLSSARLSYARLSSSTFSSAAPISAAATPTPTPVAKVRSDRTVRIGCREYESGAQSCVYEGVACVDVRSAASNRVRPHVFLIDNSRNDKTPLTSHRWCNLRHRSADPRYFGPRIWPLRDTEAPQWSCLDAQWRTSSSLFGSVDKSKIQWKEEMAFVDLDYVNNDHNNHYVKDTVWMLDVSLWQDAMRWHDLQEHDPRVLFRPFKHIFLPQGRNDFERQTRRDVNRLNLAIILRLNPRALYQGVARDFRGRMRARPMLEAFPELEEKLVFYRDALKSNSTDLVCTRRLTVGSKLGNMGHERVCRHLRERAWDLYDIKEPSQAASGFLIYPRPPRRVVILQRHITRSFENIAQIQAGLKAAGLKHNFEVELRSTAEISTAEEHVKFFSRIGVLVTPHGSQAMGAMWMPRHAALVEVMPPGYTDFAFNLLAEACKMWYYELQAVVPPGRREWYKRKCGRKMNSLFDQCVAVKTVSIVANVTQLVETVTFALRRLGHDMPQIL